MELKGNKLVIGTMPLDLMAIIGTPKPRLLLSSSVNTELHKKTYRIRFSKPRIGPKSSLIGTETQGRPPVRGELALLLVHLH